MIKLSKRRVANMIKEEIYVKSSIDGSVEPSLFFRASKPGRPLLVGLHTWSFGRENPVKLMLPYAEKYDFNLLCPEFRGSNLVKNPRCTEACGSMLARMDIKDAIDKVIAECEVDRENVFLLGLSGGGHMALLMAGLCPEYFRAIGAVVPISDLEWWCEQNASYAPAVRACCSNSAEEMKLRSPFTHLDTIARANLKVFHGKRDPVVPVAQSLRFYDEMMKRYPDSRVYLDIFDGGHEIDMESAMHWLLTQSAEKSLDTVTG